MNRESEAAVFLLLGQSNAVGHGTPMEEHDKITEPLTHVFGLSREQNQSFDHDKLFWSGYTSFGMNLAEEQDNTYSLANCLARLWQDRIDRGEELPDLYIVQIAIGAQGITKEYMWWPYREPRLVPGKLWTVDISLYPYTLHFFSLLKKSLLALGKTQITTQLHWRGGEEDSSASWEELEDSVKGLYDYTFNGFYEALGERVPIVMHKAVSYDRCMEVDPTGESLKKKHFINGIFETLCLEHDNITMFDVTEAPHFVAGVRGNGIYIDDAVHYSPKTNRWVAEKILES